MFELSLLKKQPGLFDVHLSFDWMLAEHHAAADVSYPGVHEAQPLFDFGEFRLGSGALSLNAAIDVAYELRSLDLKGFQIGFQLVVFPGPPNDIFLGSNATLQRNPLAGKLGIGFGRDIGGSKGSQVAVETLDGLNQLLRNGFDAPAQTHRQQSDEGEASEDVAEVI